MTFKKGDKVVCVDDRLSNLVKGLVYVVEQASGSKVKLEGVAIDFSAQRFKLQGFQVGDKIVCVNNEEFENILILGSVYTVVEQHMVDGDDCVVLSGCHTAFLSSRFKFASSTKPQLSECICSNDQIFNGGCICGFITPYKLEW